MTLVAKHVNVWVVNLRATDGWGGYIYRSLDFFVHAIHLVVPSVTSGSSPRLLLSPSEEVMVRLAKLNLLYADVDEGRYQISWW